MDLLLPGLLGAALIAALIWAVSLSAQLRGRSEVSPGRAASPTEAAPRRLAEVIEDLSALDARFKGIERQWNDFSKSWERRWGTVTRQMHRDQAQDPGIVGAAGADGEHDPEIVLPPVVTTHAGDPGRTALRPIRLRLPSNGRS